MTAIASTLLVLQTVASTFDLANLPKAACDRRRSGEIIVCAKRDQSQRIRVDPNARDDIERILPRAEVRLFGEVKADLTVKQRTLDRGAVSQPIMVTVKMPF